jgi:site-specific DNA-methyltransferase (adenine-specific)
MINLLHGDCLEQMKQLPDNSVDSIVTDPPYGISFMAKKWDYDVPKVEVWKEAMRVLKPGGHALIACGTRTQHRMVVNIEDAGFEIRDVVSWIYGSGFPKSLNIGKAIDKAAGAKREVVGVKVNTYDGCTRNPEKHGNPADQSNIGKWGLKDTPHGKPETAPATEAAKQWDGWGTALKPACEFFTLCRKPLSEKTVAANVLKWGTGGINIDGCRVEGKPRTTHKDGNFRTTSKDNRVGINSYELSVPLGEYPQPAGRFPANLIHDGSQQVLELFPETKARGNKSECMSDRKADIYEYGSKSGECGSSANKDPVGFVGSAARFFYCPKASKKDRDEGLEGFEEKEIESDLGSGDICKKREDRVYPLRKNTHPTVKPTALMQYLCRLITPTGGVVLDPYMGSGSTGKAAVKEGFSFVGCELDEDYFKIATARIK